MNVSICFKTIIYLSVGGVATYVNAADAQYPTRPIRLLVPFAAGGGADTMARILTPPLRYAIGV